jgi:hypothetical protein
MAASRQSKPGMHDEGRRDAEDQASEAARQQGQAGGQPDAHEVTGQRGQDVGEHCDTAGDRNHQCQIGTTQDQQGQLAIYRMTCAGDNNNAHNCPPNTAGRVY